MKKITLEFFIRYGILVLNCIPLYSQITLKHNNFVSVGDTIIEHYENFPSGDIDVGTPGPNKVWDFSNLKSIASDTLTFINPKETPFSKEFSDANIVLYTKRIYGVWMFMQHTNSGLTGLGSGVFIQGKKHIDKRQETVIKYPLKYLDSTSNKTQNHAIIARNKQGKDSIKRTTVYEHKTLVDSWGDAILPKGTFLCLRLKHAITATTYFYKKQSDKWVVSNTFKNNTSIYYQWWTNDKNTKHPIAQIVMDDNHEKPIVAKFLSASPFVEIMDTTPEVGLKLYPNPAKEHVFVDIKTKDLENYVSLYAYNGKLVKNIKTTSAKHKVNLETLANGTYFVVIRNKGGKITGKSRFIKSN